MYVYTNSLKNLLCNKGRNIFVSVILIIVMTATTLSLYLRNMSKEMITNYQKNFGIETNIITDWEYADSHTQTVENVLPDGTIESYSTFEAEEITMEKYEQFANSKYVKKALLTAATNYTSNHLEAIPLDESLSRLEGMSIEELMDFYEVTSLNELYEFLSENEIVDITSWKKDVIGQIWGYTDINQSIDFSEGRRKITEGRYFEKQGEVIVGKKFAEQNNLYVGDCISITGGKKTDTQEYKLTIVGIFTDYQLSANDGDIWLGINSNDIIVSYDTLKEMDMHGIFPISDEIKFYLTDSNAPNAFLEELRELGLPECYKLQYDLDGYNQIVEPVEKMESIATTFGIVIFLVGAVVLAFLSIINIRERKYEIGVLRAIGMKKSQIARGMIYESTTLVILCTFLGTILGGLLAKPISHIFIVQKYSIQVSISYDLEMLLMVILIAGLLAFLSSLIGILNITKFEPMKILSEQN